MSRRELINEITKAREDAKANLLYVKGLTKMKKEELQEISKVLRQNGRNINRDELRELQQEKEKIKDELNELKVEEKEEEAKLQELDIDDEEQEEEEEESENTLTPEKEEEEKKEEEEEEEEEDEYPLKREEIETYFNDKDDTDSEDDNKTEFYNSLERMMDEEKDKHKKNNTRKKKDLERQIRSEMGNFSKSLSNELKPYQRKYRLGTLDNIDIEEIINIHNDLREDTMLNIDMIIDNLDIDDDFNENFYDYVNNFFEKKINRVNRMLK